MLSCAFFISPAHRPILSSGSRLTARAKPCIDRFKAAGRGDLAKAPYARRDKEGKLVLTLLESKRCRHLQDSNRCGIYAIRPHSCSEFPMGSECCIFAREDILKLHDGVPPEEAN